jgi:predicted O-methyltransferase YrrM
MTENEQNFLRKNLNSTQRVLEWGCGASTIDISNIVNEVHSIEHNEDWYNKIKQELLNNTNVFLYLCQPDEKYVEGGHCGTFQQFETYVKKPLELGKFDLIFIDGRARIECAKICKDISHKDTLIFIHDYRGRYEVENYKEIENYLNFISEINNLAFFSIKK